MRMKKPGTKRDGAIFKVDLSPFTSLEAMYGRTTIYLLTLHSFLGVADL